jgi:hypothetical protein
MRLYILKTGNCVKSIDVKYVICDVKILTSELGVEQRRRVKKMPDIIVIFSTGS